LTDPVKLADAFKRGVGLTEARGITVTIKGKHDWVNRARGADAVGDADRDANVEREVDAIKEARTDEERTQAAVRLMELIG
jgi:hypothetical protein